MEKVSSWFVCVPHLKMLVGCGHLQVFSQVKEVKPHMQLLLLADGGNPVFVDVNIWMLTKLVRLSLSGQQDKS